MNAPFTDAHPGTCLHGRPRRKRNALGHLLALGMMSGTSSVWTISPIILPSLTLSAFHLNCPSRDKGIIISIIHDTLRVRVSSYEYVWNSPLGDSPSTCVHISRALAAASNARPFRNDGRADDMSASSGGGSGSAARADVRPNSPRLPTLLHVAARQTFHRRFQLFLAS